MHKRLISVFTFSLLVAACGKAGITPASLADAPAEPMAATAKYVPTQALESEYPASVVAEPDPEAAFLEEMATFPVMEETELRNAGDRTVSRISGSFAPNPMTLTEEVIDAGGTMITIDYTLEEGNQSTRLRVTRDSAGIPRRVMEMKGAKETPSSVEAFRAMMKKTVFMPDDSQGKLGTDQGVCLLGSEPVECEKTAYRVKVGETTATYFLARSQDGQDLSAEIADKDGKIIYKTQLIQVTNAVAGVASR